MRGSEFEMEFLIAGASCATAVVFTNPLDMIKTRMQVQGELLRRGEYTRVYRNPLHGLWTVFRKEGLFKVQAGLVSAMGYQLVMNGIRLGAFRSLENRGWIQDPNGNVSITRSAIGSSLSGIAGGVMGAPLYLVKTQIQVQSTSGYAVGHQHAHVNTLDAFKRIYLKNGFFGLFQGVSAAVPRIMSGSSSQLVSFSLSKDWLHRKNIAATSTWQNSFLSAFLSGFAVVLVMTPWDVLSTRLCNQPLSKEGKGLVYSGYLDCLKKVASSEGFFGLYKGSMALYLRVGPHSLISLFLWNEMNKHYEKSSL